MEYKNIKEDFYYTTSAETLTYTIFTDGTAIYNGKAYRNPSDGMIRINVAQRVRDYLGNEMPDFRNLVGDVVFNEGSVMTFTITDEYGTVLETYTVLLDYEGEWDGGDKALSDPINFHADMRQKIFYTAYSSTGGTIELTQ